MNWTQVGTGSHVNTYEAVIGSQVYSITGPQANRRYNCWCRGWFLGDRATLAEAQAYLDTRPTPSGGVAPWLVRNGD